MVEVNDRNVGIAFAITIGAGLSTALGASIVFFPRLVQYANRSTLASALGFSAGVMTYVSFVEIFRKSVESFVEGGYNDVQAFKLATLCFFGGVFVMLMLNSAVSCLLHGHHHLHYHHDHFDHHGHHDHHGHQNQTNVQSGNDDMEGVVVAVESQKENTGDVDEAIIEFSPCQTCSEDPVRDLQRIQTMANEIEEKQHSQEQSRMPKQGSVVDEEENNGKNPEVLPVDTTTTEEEEEEAEVNDEEERKRLAVAGVNTAIAIGLHNFPEGLATFVAVLNDPKVGFVLAIAIAIHNIPEGICVALPVYYSSGSRRKAFILATVSGISEPIAAVFGYLILASIVSDVTYGVLFGIVSGMMVMICTCELIPTAHRYDPDDSYVTTSYIIGMAVMALTLVLFVA